MSRINPVSRMVFGLFIVAAMGLYSSSAAMAGSEPVAVKDPCANSVVDADEAKQIAADYMKDLGYNEHVGGSIWHFSLQESNCVNGQWRINVDLGPHIALKDKAMVLVNCQTGEVEDHFSPDLAAE